MWWLTRSATLLRRRISVVTSNLANQYEQYVEPTAHRTVHPEACLPILSSISLEFTDFSRHQQRPSASEMTYTVSGGALNSTHLLTYSNGHQNSADNLPFSFIVGLQRTRLTSSHSRQPPVVTTLWRFINQFSGGFTGGRAGSAPLGRQTDAFTHAHVS